MSESPFPKRGRPRKSRPELENNPDLSSFDKKVMAKLSPGEVNPVDILPVRAAIDKVAHPNKSYIDIHDELYPDQAGTVDSTKYRRITKQITRVVGKYPDIFKSFRDKNVVDIEKVASGLVDLARNSEKDSDKISASKVLISSAIAIEKMAKDKKTESISIEARVFEDKSFQDIIDEGREKHGTVLLQE
jgi:hypothetical protein